VNGQHKQIFDLFALADPVAAAIDQILDVRFATDGSVKWSIKEVKTKSDADALKADMAAPKILLSTYKLYRDHMVPALILQKLNPTTSLADFQTEIGGLVKKSTLPFYAPGTLDKELSLRDFKAQAENYELQNTGRWRAFDSLMATELDRAATSAGSLLGVIDLYIAVENIVRAQKLDVTLFQNLVVAGMGFANDGLSRLAASSTVLAGELGAGLKQLSTTLSQKVLQRALFLFAILDLAVQIKNVEASTSKAEVIGSALIALGGIATVGASGLGILAGAGIITVAAAPFVVAAFIGAALGLLGWAVIALFHQSYPEQILRGSFFRKNPDDRTVALEADKEAVDLRTGFVEQTGGKVTENFALQIAYAVGLTRGFAPSARDVTGFLGLGDRAVEYKIERTPNSSVPPTKKADLDFASSVYVMNLDFDMNGNAFLGTVSNEIKDALFTDFVNPVTKETLDDKEPPLEFEVRTSFKAETLTFEPIGLAIKRWMAEQIVVATGAAPDWQPSQPERLEIRERARAI
jgi:hypothetical protein